MRPASLARGPIAGLLLAVLASFAPGTALVQGQQPRTAAHVANELLVRFRSDLSPARQDAAVNGFDGAVMRRFDRVGVVRVRLRAGMPVTAALAIAQADPDVMAAQPNFIRHVDATTPPNDPYWVNDSLWGLIRIQAQAAWTTFTTGTTAAVVADIDSGVKYDHGDLAANMWRNPGEIPGNGVDDDGNGYVDDIYGIDTLHGDSDPMDDNGHGTHTAGIFGAVGNNGLGVVGVNWNTRILACKFIGTDGNGTDADAIECFNYIVMMKNRGVNIRVSSNSWGGRRDLAAPFPAALKAAIDTAGAAGILNVFAAGNDSANDDVIPFDPASFTSPSILTVAASDPADAPASFTNIGPTTVDLAAPGTAIWSTYGNTFAPLSGTSMAAPHVAGAAALLLARQPGLTVAALKSTLIGSVDVVPSWSGRVASGGRLNVYKAMLATQGNAAPAVTLTSPADGATFDAPATVTITADASDSDGTIAKVEFLVNSAIAATDTIAPYSATISGLTPGTYVLTAVATDSGGATTTSAPRTITVTTATGSTAAVAFVMADASTQGTWKGTYGSQGAVIVGDTATLPGDVQLAASGQSSWTWASSSGDGRALQRSGGDRVMAAWYGGSIALDLNVAGGAARRVAVYAADYDNSGRQQRFDVVDAATGAVLDSRTLSAFGGGQYLVWSVLGHVVVRVTALAGPNAVVSGVFVGGTAGGGSGAGGTASYVRLDGSTQGSWKGVYGASGYAIAADVTSLPAGYVATPTGASSWTWAASTGDGRALQRAASDRVMAAWYGGSFSFDVTVPGTEPQQVALYAADYDNAGRQQRLEILDGASGAVLDTRTLTAFGGGQYVVWSVLGHVTIQVTSVAGPNAVVSGLFFAAGSTVVTGGTATFVKSDVVTQGSWKGAYGSAGSSIVADATSLPSDVQLMTLGGNAWIWATATGDLRALQRASSGRVMAAYYGATFSVDLTVTAPSPRQIAFYVADYDSSGRQQRIDVVDAASGALLDSRTVTSFPGGVYLAWDIQGHVRIDVTRLAGPNALLSGLFVQ